jgi:hypothetical protein
MYLSTVCPMMTGPSSPDSELVTMAPKASATLRFSSAMSGASRLSADPSVAFRSWPAGLLSA